MERIKDIADKLRHPEEEIRRQAIEELVRQSGADVLVLLNDAMGDTSWRVRKTALEAIVRYPDKKSAVNFLINALYDSENVGRRTTAIEALIQIGREHIDDIIASYQTDDKDVRKFIIDILGELKDQRAVPCLLRAINDPDENVRLAAVEALGKVNSEQAVAKLLELVEKSNDVALRFSALHILGKLNQPLPEDMIDRLAKERLFRRAVYEILRQVPSRRGVEHLLRGLTDPAKSVRQTAIRSLAKIYESDTNGWLREQIEQGLAKALNNEALERMAEFLEGNHHSTKRAVLRLFSLIVNEQAWRYLFQASLDDSVSVEVGEFLEGLREKYPNQFRKFLSRQPEEVRQAVKKLIQEEELIVLGAKQIPEQMTDEEFNIIRVRLSASYGIYFDDEMKYLVERRARMRMRELGLKRFSDYIAYLQDPINGSKELYELTNLLVTNETYFFREEFQLRAFQEEIMPELIQSVRQQGRGKIKIWSAGCSSGEEPYTIAMLISERTDLEGIKVEIYGTDLSKEMIEKAKKGIYSSNSFRVIDKYWLEKYFIPRGDKLQIKDEIKRMVRFDCSNLLSYNYPDYLNDLDVIFCRNVLIYFSLEAKRALVERFYQVLREGGFLLLGHSESLINLSTAFKLRHFKSDLVYQKPELGERKWKKM